MACGLKRSQKENQKTFIKHLPNSRPTVLLTFADVCPVCEYRITFVERNDLQTLHNDLAVAIFGKKYNDVHEVHTLTSSWLSQACLARHA